MTDRDNLNTIVIRAETTLLNVQTMIKNIIFDLGGVIVTISQQEAIRRFTALGLTDAERRLDPYTQQGIFGDLEEGLITAEDFRRGLSELTGCEQTYEACRWGWLGYRADLPKRNLDALRRLRREGYRLILLSNTNPFMMSWGMSDEFDGEGHSLHYYFDSCYLSYRLKMMKPSEQFFSYVIDKEGIAPSETLFVDDGPRNVAAAARLGIHTFCPGNGDDWTRKIYDYL